MMVYLFYEDLISVTVLIVWTNLIQYTVPDFDCTL